MLRFYDKKPVRLSGIRVLIVVIALFWIIPQITSSAEGEKPIYPGYPLSFDGTGSLDGMSKDKIVVNDGSFMLASDAIFNQPDFLNSGPKGFRTGDTIGFVLNSKGEIESVWLIQRNPKKK